MTWKRLVAFTTFGLRYTERMARMFPTSLQKSSRRKIGSRMERESTIGFRSGRGAWKGITMRLRCKVGLHQWYTDSAMFSAVCRCNYCPAVGNRTEAAVVDQERALWALYQDLPFEEGLRRVHADLITNPEPRGL
jgi:hypothetical protein